MVTYSSSERNGGKVAIYREQKVTNINIFDHPYFEAVFGGAIFPDGSFVIDFEEEIIEFQKLFLQTMSNIRSSNMMTFPVSTISLLVDKEGNFVDEEFAKWSCEHNRKWNDSNFFADTEVTSLSSCCFDGSQECIVRTSMGQQKINFEKLYTFALKTRQETFEVLYKDKWKLGKLICLKGRTSYKIVTQNDRTLIATDNHLHPTKGWKNKPTTELTTEDYLIYCDFDNPSVELYDKIVSITKLSEIPKYVYCFEMQDKKEPYFTLANGIITHNCRLRNDIKELGYMNSIGGTALKVGSVKVSTINLARIAYISKTEEEYLENLREATVLNMKMLDVQRHIIERNIEKGLLPNFSHNLIEMKYLYSSIGILGIFETMKHFGYTQKDQFGNTFYTEKAIEFGKKIFATIHEERKKFQEDKDYMFNLEAVPAESMASRFQFADELLFPDKVVKDLPLYGNQWMPLGIKTTLKERIRIAALFSSFCSGGDILHLNVDAPFDSFEKAWQMLQYVAKQGVKYFAFTGKISACKNNHAFYGTVCPICGKPVDTYYSRIVGFFVPVKNYSIPREQEWKMREWHNVN